MDFADLDLRAASDRGSWVPLIYKGEPVTDDKGNASRVLVRGMGSDGVLDAFRKVERVDALRRDRLNRAADKDADAVMAKYQKDQEAAMAELIVAAVGDWEGVIYSGKALPCTPENVLKICGPGSLFFGQVNAAIVDEHRLFTKPDSA